QAGGAPLPVRSRRAVHQQPGRTRWPNDETAAEDLRRISLRGRSRRVRGHPLAALDGKETGLGYPAHTHRSSKPVDRRIAASVSRSANLGSYVYSTLAPYSDASQGNDGC